MPEDADNVVVLTTVFKELEAELIVAALHGQGVQAMVEGGLSGSMRTDAPGCVKVLVKQGDLAKAQEILREMEEERSHGDDEEPAE